MYRDLTAGERSKDRATAVSARQLQEAASKPGGENQNEPLLPDAQENPEFAKWWRRWMSRVQRIAARRKRPGRRGNTDPRNSDPKVSGALSADCEFRRSR